MELSPKQQIKELVDKAGSILIAIKKNPRGDDLGGALALMRILKKTGKEVIIACADKAEKKYEFLSLFGEIKSEVKGKSEVIISVDTKNDKLESLYYKKEDNKLNIYLTPKDKLPLANISLKERKANFDLIFVLNSADLESLGDLYDNNTELFFNTPVINIDNHSSNEYFAPVNFIEITSASTSEIIYNLTKSISAEIDEKIATCLLAGIIDRTDNFMVSSVAPSTLETASELVKKGADRESIIRYLYKTKSLSSLKLWGRVMAKLNYSAEHKIAWALIAPDDFLKTGAAEEDIKFAAAEIANASVDINFLLVFYSIDGAQYQGVLRLVENNVKKGLMQSLVSILSGQQENDKLIKFKINSSNLQFEAQKVLEKLKNWLER